MDNSKNRIVGLACSIFEKEIQTLIDQNKISIPFEYLDSLLHMNPDLLEKKMKATISANGYEKYMLLYGDCHSHMIDLQLDKNIKRVCGINCNEIILGEKIYRKLRAEGAFFFLPEWTKRWKEVFQEHLGFNSKTAIDFMGEMFKKLIYLDTGVMPVPSGTLSEISDFFDLPVEVLPVNLDYLHSHIIDTLGRLSDE